MTYTSDQILNLMGASTPLLLIGATLSHGRAAGFAMAMSLVMMPFFLLVGALSRVTLPALAGCGEVDLQRRVLDVVGGAAAFIPPVLIGIAVLADSFVTLLLGDSWVATTVPLIRWIVCYCVLAAVFSPVASLDVIRSRVDLGLLWNIATFVVRFFSVSWGLSRGVEFAVAAFSVSSAIMWLINGVLLSWLLQAGHLRFHRAWLRFVPFWALIGFGFWTCANITSSGIFVLILSVVPALIYFVAVCYWFPDVATMLRRIVDSGAGRRAPVISPESGSAVS